MLWLTGLVGAMLAGSVAILGTMPFGPDEAEDDADRHRVEADELQERLWALEHGDAPPAVPGGQTCRVRSSMLPHGVYTMRGFRRSGKSAV